VPANAARDRARPGGGDPGRCHLKVLVRSTAHYRALLGDVSAQVMKLASRDIDRGGMRLGMAAE
jgi:hypothetical protein